MDATKQETSMPVKIVKGIIHILDTVIPTLTFTVIFVAFLSQIIARYAFNKSLNWSNEVSVLAYMWTMYFGVGKAIDTDAHAVFSLVYDAVNQKKRLIFRVLYNVLLIACLVICIVPCVNKWNGQIMKTGVLKLPYKVVFAPFLYMLVELIIRSFLEILKAFKNYKEGTL